MEPDNIKQKTGVFQYRHDKNVTVDEVTEVIKKGCERPGQLLGYRTMYHKIRQGHGLNITRDQVYAAMTESRGIIKGKAHTQEKENEEYILFCWS